MKQRTAIPIVIPVYNPPELFVPFVKRLRTSVSAHIIVINDGSDNVFRKYFSKIRNFPKTTVIGYRSNAGKGAALKYAMRYIGKYFGSVGGIITVDADGQHETDDIRTCFAFARKNPDALCIGKRIPRKHMPIRSRTGNAVTRTFLFLLHRYYVTDTQSGLRYIPWGLMERCKASLFNAYDFELDMIIQALRSNMGIVEFPMRPIYINKNKASHYKTFRDSFHVASVFLHHFRASG